eukprot:TRINITY_DN12854_c0_g1_i6.p2 TRINITY_DN12854_c0_g1~~TRINITY_DN12854_c0_g1_i6.p2  ORF type:complete len:162 (-),score=6.19 TRINITY_DN12854_c0_g1_i6:230-715(-)
MLRVPNLLELRCSDTSAVSSLPAVVVATQTRRRSGSGDGKRVCRNHLEEVRSAGWAVDNAGREAECGVQNFNCPNRTTVREKRKRNLKAISGSCPPRLLAKILVLVAKYVHCVCHKCRLSMVNKTLKKRPPAEADNPGCKKQKAGAAASSCHRFSQQHRAI